MIIELVKFGLKKAGLKIQKINEGQNDLSMEGALKRCINRGLKINSVVDVGASNGIWSSMCIQFLPNARYLLIEAQQEHKKGLEKFKSNYANADYVIAAAGKKEGKIYFNNKDLFGGLASEEPFEENCVEVPVITLDSEVKKHRMTAPYLLKLDTHGFELPILEGAAEVISNAALIIIETYNFKLTNSSLKYYEMCQHMEKLGFSSVEMVDFMTRKYDGSFWQMDTFFIPSNRKEFMYNAYA